jgi:uncharacterized protein (DUF983 family)
MPQEQGQCFEKLSTDGAKGKADPVFCFGRAAMTVSFLPATFRAAALRGLAGKCPRCGGAHLFGKWLKPLPQCPACAQDWSHQQADDFPAYVAILITGHLMAPLIIMLVSEYDLSAPVLLGIILSLSVTMMLGMLQPVKGAIIAAQWWHGLHGFVKERRSEPVAGPE